MKIIGTLVLILMLNIGIVDDISGVDKAGEEILTAYVHFDKGPPYSYIESNYGWYNHKIRRK